MSDRTVIDHAPEPELVEAAPKPPPKPPPEVVQGRRLTKTIFSALRRLLTRHPKFLIFGWSLAVLAFLVPLPAAYFAWYKWPPYLWDWTGQVWYHWLPGFFGFILMFSIPIYAVMAAAYLTGFLADISLEIEDAVVHEAQKNVHETEQEAISRLEQSDAPGLLPLLKYSRAQLEAYYTVGLSQAKKSYFNSVLAMWLGFVILLAGVALYMAPVENIGLKPPTQDIKILIMVSAVIIEFISALFLWIYRSSIGQLNLFYERQMYTHTSIICFRIATTMESSKADDTKGAIVRKLLDWASKLESLPLPDAKGLQALLPAPKAAP